jgi:ribosomal protein S5
MRTPPFFNNDTKQTPHSIQEWFRQTRNDETDFFTKDVSGNSTINLTTDQSHSHIIEFTGILTGNINVIVTVQTFQFTVANKTSGAFTLTIKTPSGTGITVGQGKRCILYCDGVNVVRVTPDT